MSLNVRLIDATGTNQGAVIKPHGDLLTVGAAHPPYGGQTTMRVFRQFLTNGGTSSDSSDMLVDGSSTNVDFWVPAHSDRERYLCGLSFVIADAGAAPNEFANIGALTNGCRLFYTDELGEVDIHDALKTNFNFERLCRASMIGVGATTNALRLSNVSGGSEAFVPYLDLKSVFGFQWGLRLRAGSGQRLTLRVRDNLTTADQFDAIVYGFERLPDDQTI